MLPTHIPQYTHNVNERKISIFKGDENIKPKLQAGVNANNGDFPLSLGRVRVHGRNGSQSRTGVCMCMRLGIWVEGYAQRKGPTAQVSPRMMLNLSIHDPSIHPSTGDPTSLVTALTRCITTQHSAGRPYPPKYIL